MTRVAIQGVIGSYSEEAAREILGVRVTVIECHDFDETFSAVRLGHAETAVVPVENKIVGDISRPLELLDAGHYRVLDRLTMKVRHVLAGTADATLENLASVRSHIEALKQCRSFLTANAHLRQVIGADTASSIKRIVDEGDPANGAIGSARAARLYGARILAENIADDRDNWTTFYLIGN